MGSNAELTGSGHDELCGGEVLQPDADRLEQSDVVAPPWNHASSQRRLGRRRTDATGDEIYLASVKRRARMSAATADKVLPHA